MMPEKIPLFNPILLAFIMGAAMALFLMPPRVVEKPVITEDVIEKNITIEKNVTVERFAYDFPEDIVLAGNMSQCCGVEGIDDNLAYVACTGKEGRICIRNGSDIQLTAWAFRKACNHEILHNIFPNYDEELVRSMDDDAEIQQCREKSLELYGKICFVPAC